MALTNRLELYREVETLRERPLICYVTSSRQGSQGLIASDTVPELLLQLQALPANTTELDLLLVSNGGDPTVAWRIVSLIRERTRKFSVLVPQAAYSAATLIALGADEIVMHAHGNLGPTDPQIHAPRKGQKDGTSDSVPFGSEDLAAFLRFAREEVGLGDQAEMLAVFQRFCDDVGAVGVGLAARSAQLTVNMGEKLLQLHMPGETDKPKARAISEKLTRDFFHHGYPVSRAEAREIGLKIAASDQTLESLMWRIWEDISSELKLREPFNALSLLRADPACGALFAPVQQVGVVQVPPTPFEIVHSLMESARVNSRFVSRGLVFGSRLPDHQFRVTAVPERQGWTTVESAGTANASADGTGADRSTSTRTRRPRARS